MYSPQEGSATALSSFALYVKCDLEIEGDPSFRETCKREKVGGIVLGSFANFAGTFLPAQTNLREQKLQSRVPIRMGTRLPRTPLQRQPTALSSLF